MKKALIITLGGLCLVFAGILLYGALNKPGVQAPATTTVAADLPVSARQAVLLVNDTHALPEGYDPWTLVDLYGQKQRSFQLATADLQLEQETFEAADRMFDKTAQDGVEGFIMTSAFRTQAKQQEIYDSITDGTAALPGHSEHQTGLAFDVTAYSGGNFAATDQFAWLSRHCWEYGFILRYPQAHEDETGIPYEPWHYRYVGTEIALALRDSGQTLEAFVGN